LGIHDAGIAKHQCGAQPMLILIHLLVFLLCAKLVIFHDITKFYPKYLQSSNNLPIFAS
jgi:hypothetical protein